MNSDLLVKICGITRVDDALAAAEEGADFIGLNFAPGSPRQLSLQQASAIAEAVRQVHRATPRIVGVFQDAEAESIEQVRRRIALDVVQLHGDEPALITELIQAPVMRAFRIIDEMPPTMGWEGASWFLFDGRAPGTGRSFDWSLIERERIQQPYFLAGGLTPENVASAVSRVRPAGVDTASGVEVGPGIKDQRLIRRFIQEARNA